MGLKGSRIVARKRWSFGWLREGKGCKARVLAEELLDVMG